MARIKDIVIEKEEIRLEIAELQTEAAFHRQAADNCFRMCLEESGFDHAGEASEIDERVGRLQVRLTELEAKL